MVLHSIRRTATLFAILATLLTAGAVLGADKTFPPLVNWTAPATFSPHSVSRGASTMADIKGPVAFVATTPCRQYDSRNFTPLLQNTSRAVVLTGAPCGLPTSALAVSVNITIFNIIGATGNGVFQVGTATGPTFAWINFPPTEAQRGNAGSLPIDGSDQLWVRVQMGGGQLDFTVDVNGYYPAFDINNNEQFEIVGNSGGVGIIYGQNDSSSGFATSGVRGYVTGTGADASGVLGQSVATSGFGHGLYGRSSSEVINNSAVLGVMGTRATAPTSWSEAAGRFESFGGNGVIGLTNAGGNCGVIGTRYDAAGVVQTSGLVGCTNGLNYTGGLSGSGTKNFLEPHPTDASKMIRYTSLEGPESGTYFRGTARTVGGFATIHVPESFRIVTDDEGLTVQLTPVGSAATMYVLSEDLNQIVVRSSKDVTFHYLVQGVRRAYKDLEAIVDNDFFKPRGPTDRMPTYSAVERQRLIQSGIYNEDGTPNMETAQRLGWAKEWAEKSARDQGTK